MGGAAFLHLSFWCFNAFQSLFSCLGICGLIKSQFLRERAGRASLLSQKLGFYFLASPLALRIENKIKPEIFDEKRGNAALLIKNFGFYFVRDP